MLLGGGSAVITLALAVLAASRIADNADAASAPGPAEVILLHIAVGALVVAILAVIAAAVARELRRTASRALTPVVEAMDAVSRTADCSVRAGGPQRADLSEIGVSFNAMMERLQAHERALRTTAEQALTASKSKSAFIASMSHELRTPLNAIIGFSEVLQSQMLGPLGNERYSVYVKDIYDSGQHLLAVINDILDISKIEAGQFELAIQEADVRRLVEQAVRLVREKAENAGLELVAEIDPGLSRLLIDQRLLKQSVINLLSNATKFTPKGGRILMQVRQDAAGVTTITVKDSGVGIAPEDQEKVLLPFVQAENPFAADQPGTGLGLPLARSFVEAHGGSLTLSSELGHGTTVTLKLPPERIPQPMEKSA